MCRVLEVAVSGYYAWLRRAPSRRSQANTVLGERIVRIYQENRQVYGSPRIHAALRAEGTRCGRKRVARLMREHGLSAKPRTHRTRTTDSQHEHPVAPNLLNRDFTRKCAQYQVGGRYHGDLDMARAGSIWRWCSTFSHAWWWAGPWIAHRDEVLVDQAARMALARSPSCRQADCTIQTVAVSIRLLTTGSC